MRQWCRAVAAASVMVATPALAQTEPPAQAPAAYVTSTEDALAIYHGPDSAAKTLFMTEVLEEYNGEYWASDYNAMYFAPQIFCPPRGLKLTADDVMGDVDHYMRDHPDWSKAKIGFTVMLAMRELYPCPTSRR